MLNNIILNGLHDVITRKYGSLAKALIDRHNPNVCDSVPFCDSIGFYVNDKFVCVMWYRFDKPHFRKSGDRNTIVYDLNSLNVFESMVSDITMAIDKVLCQSNNIGLNNA